MKLLMALLRRENKFLSGHVLPFVTELICVFISYFFFEQGVIKYSDLYTEKLGLREIFIQSHIAYKRAET